MKMETCSALELLPPALDWAVAHALGLTTQWSGPDSAFRVIEDREGVPVFLGYISTEGIDDVEDYTPSTSWVYGGPLLSKHAVGLLPPEQSKSGKWQAHCVDASYDEFNHADSALIALCRCIVAEGSGYEVEVPVRLLP